VGAFVAVRVECDQVLFDIASRLAAEFKVVYLQVLHGPAILAAPAVTFQHLAMQVAIARRVEPESRAFGWDFLQGA
jgi:hypothetical protein